VSRVFRQHSLGNRSLSIHALHHSNLSRRRLLRRDIRMLSANLIHWKILKICKDYPTHCSIILSLCWSTLREAHSGHAQPIRAIRCSLWSMKLVSLTWRSYTAFVPMQEPEMNSCSMLGSSLQASSKLKQHSPSQCWMTS
jgi:hypothetical protein